MTPSKILYRYVANSPAELGDFIASCSRTVSNLGAPRTFHIMSAVSLNVITRPVVWIIEVCEG